MHALCSHHTSSAWIRTNLKAMFDLNTTHFQARTTWPNEQVHPDLFNQTREGRLGHGALQGTRKLTTPLLSNNHSFSCDEGWSNPRSASAATLQVFNWCSVWCELCCRCCSACCEFRALVQVSFQSSTGWDVEQRRGLLHCYNSENKWCDKQPPVVCHPNLLKTSSKSDKDNWCYNRKTALFLFSRFFPFPLH